MCRLRFTVMVAAGAVVISWGRSAITEEPQSVLPERVAADELEEPTEPVGAQAARDVLLRGIGLLAQRPDPPLRDRDRPRRSREEVMERVMEHLRSAVEQLHGAGYHEIAESLVGRAEQIQEQLQQRRRPRDEERPPRGPLVRDRRSPIQQAIGILRETGHGEAAQALASAVEELHAARRQRPLEREPRRERDFAHMHPDINHTIRQVLDDVRRMRDNPPVHPEISHVLQDLRREVEALRRDVNELRRGDERRPR